MRSHADYAMLTRMNRTRLHVEALRAVLDIATSQRRWPSVSQIATEAGISSSVLFNIISEKVDRDSMSRDSLDKFSDALGIDRAALLLPTYALGDDARRALLDRVDRMERRTLDDIETWQVDISNLARDVRQLGD